MRHVVCCIHTGELAARQAERKRIARFDPYNLTWIMPTKGVLLKEHLSTTAMAFVWFGAAVSLAEILTGTFFAPLGFGQGMLAIVIGHVIGGVLFWLAAYIGAKTGKSAMETVKISFGTRGSLVFSLANVAQLVGWTSIMIVSGAAAAHYLVPALGVAGWVVIIAALIILWIALGVRNMGRVQAAASLLLFALTLVVSFTVFGGASSGTDGANTTLGFGAAVELAVAMPLSWLPVVSDYTRRAKRPVAGTAAATIAYFVGSTWMFAIGLGTALFAGAEDVTAILASAGLGIVGILVVVLSTVTTTFLDAASAGISATSIFSRLNAKYVGIGAAAIGAALAVFAPVASFEGFLYLIGSFFAPMIAILAVDFYLLHEDASNRPVNWLNLVIWLGGFILYRMSMSWDFVLGNTLPVMVIVAVVSFAAHSIRRFLRVRRRASSEALKEQP